MAMWMGNEPITDEVLFEDFPEQCFPEIEGLRVRSEKKALHICGDDTDWALQSDISLAVGPGCMLFFHTGEIRFRVDGPEGRRDFSLQEMEQTALPKLEELRMVRRGQPWEFLFGLSGSTTLTLYAEITAISWRPNEME